MQTEKRNDKVVKRANTIVERGKRRIDRWPHLLFWVGLLIYSIGLGRVHLFDWDEINFAESAREMIVSGNYLDVQINFEPFWEKPPLFTWLQVVSMHLFGVGEFGARFPNALAGGITLSVLYLLGKVVRSQRMGLLWSLLYGVSFLPFFYFKSGIIDPWFNLFIFLSIYQLARYTAPLEGKEQKRSRRALLSALFLGLATLTKGPASVVIVGLVFLVMLAMWRGRVPHFRWLDVVYFIMAYASVGGLWFILQALNGHLGVLEDFVLYQIRLFRTEDAGHGGFPLYHFVMLFFGVFPASLFALPTMHRGVLRGENSPLTSHLFRYMMTTLWVVLILFSVVQTKIVHYSSMCYYPITFLATYYIDRLMEQKRQLPKWLTGLIVGVGLLVGVALIVLPLIDLYVGQLIPRVDPFTAGLLSSDGGWRGYEWIPGMILIATTLLAAWQWRAGLQKGLLTLLCGTLATMFLGVLWVVPRVEAYSQRALVEFFESKKGEECYILPQFKSYAHYFYSDRQPEWNNANEEWLMRGDIDRPAYFALQMREGDEENFVRNSPDAVRLYSKNGYLFYARYPKQKEKEN